ncbi:MAG: tol-pal system YbgF family protein, partial [Planctomycetota bacterium]
MRGVALLLLAAAAVAQPPPPDRSALVRRQRKVTIERFFRAVEQRDDLDAATKEKILRLRPDATLGGELDCIHQALTLLSPEYKRADALLMYERYEAAAEALRPLRESKDPYLRAYASYRYGLAQLNRERFEEAARAFTEVLNERRWPVGCNVDAAFYLAIAHGQAREKEKALVAAERRAQTVAGELAR